APEAKVWRHLVTFSTVTGGRPLGGYYAFVEDFQRDKVSATKARAASFGNGWVRTKGGRWAALTRAQFTADSNPATNIAAAVRDGRFLLATGGATRNTGAKLRATMELPADKDRTPPAGLPASGREREPSGGGAAGRVAVDGVVTVNGAGGAHAGHPSFA